MRWEFLCLASFDAVKHRRSRASALLTLLVAEIERFTDGKEHFAKLALWASISAASR